MVDTPGHADFGGEVCVCIFCNVISDRKCKCLLSYIYIDYNI